MGVVAGGCVNVLVAQWIAHQTSDLGVGGSSPPRDCSFFFFFSPLLFFVFLFFS